MRVLQVITSLRIGGAEKLIVEMAKLYKDRGLQVDVLLFDGCSTPLKQELLDEGFNVFELSKGGSVYNPLFIFKLIKYLKAYDIVHTHNTACQYFVVLAKLLSCSKLKLVTTEHNTTNRRRGMLGFKYIDRFVYNRYDKIIAVSDKSASLLKQYLGGEYDIMAIANGINLTKFTQAEPLSYADMGVGADSVVITMVAGFREQKDQDTVIRALVELPTGYILCLVGDGPRREICQKLAVELGVSERVNFMGVRGDVPSILKSSDVIVMSSHWEGLSLSNLEGMSVGRPFVASRVNGLEEITSGAGVLFEHQDYKELAEVVTRLMDDKDYYDAVAQSCLERASDYDLSKTVNSYIEVYEEGN